MLACLPDSLRLFVPLLSRELGREFFGPLQWVRQIGSGVAGQPVDDPEDECIMLDLSPGVVGAGGETLPALTTSAGTSLWVPRTVTYRVAAP